MVPPRGTQAHIRPDAPVIFKEDRLCWAVGDKPAQVDIYAQEKQSLVICLLPPNREWIGIVSESYSNAFRVFLRGGAKHYEGTLKIVSKETIAKEFPINDRTTGTLEQLPDIRGTETACQQCHSHFRYSILLPTLREL